MGETGLNLLNLWGEFGLNCGGLTGEKFPLSNIMWEALGDLKQTFCLSLSHVWIIYWEYKSSIIVNKPEFDTK